MALMFLSGIVKVYHDKTMGGNICAYELVLAPEQPVSGSP
jgi:hypothetical protein